MAKSRSVDKFMEAVRKADQTTLEAEDAAALGLTAQAHDNDADVAEDAPPPEEKPVQAAPEPEPSAEPPPTPPPAEAPAAPPEAAATPPAPPPAAPSAADKAFDRERKEAARLRAELAARNNRIAELEAAQRTNPPPPAPVAAPAPAVAPAAAPDPEPDPQQFPVEHDEWEKREFRRIAVAANERAARLEEQFGQVTRQTEEQRLTSEFDAVITTIRENYKAQHPAVDTARDYLKRVVERQFERNGNPQHLIPEQVKAAERQFLAFHANRAKTMVEQGLLPPDTNFGHFALDVLMEQAKDYGWSPDAIPALAVNGGAAARPSAPPTTPAAKVADTAARAAAGRSVSNMSARPVEPPDPAERMTAEKFAEMSAIDRARYKKAHPNVIEEIMNPDGGSGNPFTIGR
jgi:hypothetical protein